MSSGILQKNKMEMERFEITRKRSLLNKKEEYGEVVIITTSKRDDYSDFNSTAAMK